MTTAVKWGIITGLLGFAWLLGEYFTGLHDTYFHLQPFITNFELIVPLVCTWLGLREAKAKDFNGNITFAESFKTGMLIAVITAGISVAGVIVYFKLINPGWTDFMIENAKKTAFEKNEPVEKAADFARMYYSMNSYMIQSFISALGFGSVFSLVVSLFIRNKK